MTVSLKHTFQSTKDDSGDVTIVQPSNWNEEHVLTCSTARILGRTTAGTGVVEELSVGTGLSLSAGSLDVGTVPVANGGTGATTLTGYVKGNGTSALTAAATVPTSDLTGTLDVANGGTGITSAGTSGNVLTSNGSAWVSSAPAVTAWTQISSAAFVDTGTTFSSIPTTYQDLLVVLYDVRNTSGGGSSIWAYLGTSTTFQTTPIKLISTLPDTEYGYATTLIPNYKADYGGLYINSTRIATVLASPSTGLLDGTPADDKTWRVTGGINRIKVSTDGAASTGGTVVLYGK
jgi:hypothetical protein